MVEDVISGTSLLELAIRLAFRLAIIKRIGTENS